MSIIYIISVITLFISFLLIKKSDKKLDLTSWIVINFVVLFSYNTLICYLFSTIGITINLYTLSIINYILFIVLSLMIKKGRMQEYEFKKKDIIIITIFAIITIVFGFWNFGFPLEIKYVTTDSGVHYHATNNFYQSDGLLNKNGDDMMPGAYSNAGILLKVFSPYMEFVDLYKVFICFDIFMFFISGLLMHVALKQIIKSRYETIISVIISIIYMIGYPLNTLLFGYFYLQLGVMIFSTIIIIMEYFRNETIYSIYLKIILFLLCLELFFSYYLFTPAIYGALGIYYFMFFRNKSNKCINKEFISYSIITLIIPFIIGIIYNVLPGNIKPMSQVGVEGYIYRNLYSNIILFIPFVFIYLYKEKEFDYNLSALVILTTFMCLLYIGCLYKVVSTYYFYKTYFILWFLLIYLFARGIFLISREGIRGKIITTSYISIYIILLVVSLITINVKVTKKVTTDETLMDVMEIYGLNKTILTEWETDFTSEEIEILKFVHEKIEIKEDTEILILGEPKQEYWFWGIFNYRNREDPQVSITYKDIEMWNDNKKFDYLICFNRSEYAKHYKENINFNKELLYSNESGTIYKNK